MSDKHVLQQNLVPERGQDVDLGGLGRRFETGWIKRLALDAGGYLNFGDTQGDGGYGIRDNGGTIQSKNSGGSWVDVGVLSGGTTDRIAKWTSASALGVSLLSDDGTNVTLTSGDLVLPAAVAYSAANLSLVVAGDSNTGIGLAANNSIFFSTNGNIYAAFRNGEAGLVLASTGRLTWLSGTQAAGSAEITLLRDAANVLAQRNGTNAQAYRLYGTVTDASNYERLALTTTAGTGVSLLAETAGTGADNLRITLTPSGTESVYMPHIQLTGATGTAISGFAGGGAGRLGWAGDGYGVSFSPDDGTTNVRMSTSVFQLPMALSLVALTPAQITGDQNDYAPTSNTRNVWRVSSDAARNITGIAIPSNSSSRILWLVNVGSQNIVVQNQNAGSTAANRIITGTGADVTLAADDTMMLWYDDTTARWRTINTH